MSIGIRQRDGLVRAAAACMLRQVVRRPAVLSVLALVGAVAVVSAPEPGTAATSSVTPRAAIISSITLDNRCGGRAAWAFGSVALGKSLTATGAGVCRFAFASSVPGAQLRVYQRDRTGNAMEGPPASYAAFGEFGGNDWRLSSNGTIITAANSWGSDYLRSPDNGATWQLFSPGGGTTSSLSVGAGTSAWRNATNITRSNNIDANPGPPTWTVVSKNKAGGGTISPDRIAAVDYTTAFAVSGGNRVSRTIDPTATPPWSALANGNCGTIKKIVASSATAAYILGSWSDQVCRTTNGTTWTSATTGIAAGTFVQDISFAPATPTTLWAVGGGVVYRSTNSAASWTATTTVPQAVELQTVAAVSSTEAFVGGYAGLVFHTTDSGASWQQWHVPLVGRVSEMVATDANHMTVSSVGPNLMTTANGGTNWVDNGAQGADGDGSRDIDATDIDTIVTALSNGRVELFGSATTTATVLPVGFGHDNVRGVAVGSSDWFVAVGDSGKIAVTFDRGATWSLRSSGTSVDLWDVDVGSDGVAIAVGLGGTILRSTDRGITWTTRSSSGADLSRVDYRQGDGGGLAVASGWGGTIRRSTDAGVTWTTPASGVTEWIDSISIASPNVVFATDQNGDLLKSNDGGATWSVLETGTAFFRVQAVDEDHVYRTSSVVEGWQEWLQYSSDGGATWVKPFSDYDPDLTALTTVGHGRLVWAKSAYRTAISDAASSIADYSAGAWTAGTTSFGMCVQALGGAATAGSMLVDGGGSCTAVDGDPWYAVPASPTAIAQIAAAGSGSADVVWGMQAGAGATKGVYGAAVAVEAMAPG